MPNYTPSDDERKAYMYCVRNNIRISPAAIPGDNDHWHIEIFSNNKWNASPQKFDKTEVWGVCYNYCKHYYEQNRREGDSEDKS